MQENEVNSEVTKTSRFNDNYKEVVGFVAIVFFVIFLRLFLVTPAVINGESMQPNLEDGEIVLLFKLNQEIERFDIIVHQEKNSRLVKRVIGLPGEHVAYIDNKLYIDGEQVAEPFLPSQTEDFKLEELYYDIIPEDYYFVLGDNRNFSRDSRTIGLIHHDNVMGKSSVRLYPLSKIGRIE